MKGGEWSKHWKTHGAGEGSREWVLQKMRDADSQRSPVLPPLRRKGSGERGGIAVPGRTDYRIN